MPQKVSVSGLSIAFGATRALDRVSMAVNDGEFVSIVGPSGCGKSTMLNVIAGLLAPAEGSTHVAGIDGKGAPAGRKEPDESVGPSPAEIHGGKNKSKTIDIDCKVIKRNTSRAIKYTGSLLAG